MQPFHLVRQLKHDFIDYVSSKFPFAENGETELDRQLREIMQRDGSLFQDPVIQLVRSRERLSPNLDQFHPKLQRTIQSLDELRTPYVHQVKAWDRINRGLGTVISTGTGSGKSESFILPVINGLLQKGYGSTKQGIGAIFIYPMNALVHDQFFRIIRYAAGTGIRVGIYNGAFKDLGDSDRKKVIDEIKKLKADLQEKMPGVDIDQTLMDPSTLVVDPSKPETVPHILLTNYKMLEYMLLRSSDQALFERMNLEYLVLDEAHTYTGTLALEIACLLNRLKVHLQGRGDSFVPVATSATLAQGAEIPEAVINEEMRGFFDRLFGRPFEGDDWLLKDIFEKLIIADKSKLLPLVSLGKAKSSEISEVLGGAFPESLFRLSAMFAGVKADSYDTCAKAIYPWAKSIAPHLLSILLKDETGKETGLMTSWEVACQRFQKEVGGTPDTLEALLTICSHAYEDWRFPAIGLRYHLFGRAQPRIYWTLDKSQLLDDSDLAQSKLRALNFVSCRKCGHAAHAAFANPDASTPEQRFNLSTLPERFDEETLTGGAEAMVLHDLQSIPNDGEHLPKSWKIEFYDVLDTGSDLVAKFVSGKASVVGKRLVRFIRKNSSGQDVSDFMSCPACGYTPDENPAMNSHRSSASVDLSVHSASLLSKIAADGTPDGDNRERKLLIFCDNRQETSFLAGFLTDRHRRLNLRRAVASFLKTGADSKETQSWLLKRRMATDDRNPASHKFDFALRLLISVETGRFFDRNANIPSSFRIRKQTVQSLLPREVLQTHYKELKSDERKKAIRDWLLENYTLDEVKDRNAKEDRDFDLLDGSDRSVFVLELLTDVIALDLTSVQVREGSLLSLGLATWDFNDLNEGSFTEFAAANPKLGLTGKGLFLVSFWLIEKLADWGALADLDSNTARQYLGRYRSTKLQAKLSDIVGEAGINRGALAKTSVLGRLLLEIAGNESILSTWGQTDTWRKLIKESPLQKMVFLASGEQDGPRLNVTGQMSVGFHVSMWRSKLSGAWRIAPPRFNFEQQPTGRKPSDVWERVDQPPHAYYQKLFHQPLSSEARLVSAKEHNGMISAADQNEAVSRFKEGLINTLVATPTLEMGVDLPDLPTVILRSVPPDPSNYAQRAGRAGRGPKRALIFTYCGLSSHDMTFFENPLEMASGEILPPGMPVENTFLISRHLNGLILEAMGLPYKGTPTLELKSWNRLVDLTGTHERARKLLGEELKFQPVAPQDWRLIYRERAELIRSMIDRFIQLTKQNLWSSKVSESMIRNLESELRQKADLDSWPDEFAKELRSYLDQLELYLGEVEKLGDLTLGQLNRLSEEQRRAHERALHRARYFANLYLGVGSPWDLPQPISDLAASGFLPNFDFPGRVTRFRGVKFNPGSDRNRYSDLLKYDRSAQVALREFAPEQKIYGHGWVYQVDRYVAAQNQSLLTSGWGICSNSCTELIPPDNESCPRCESPVLKSGDPGNDLRPELIEVREVHGSQISVISDSSSRREMNYFTTDLKLVGAPSEDRAEALEGANEVKIHYHESRLNSFRVIQVVHRKESTQAKMGETALWREKGDNSSFPVKLNRPSDGMIANWRPFFPVVQTECPGIRLRLPIGVASTNQWIQGLTDDPGKAHLEFYRTFAAVLERAIQKVLRLNKRANHLEITEKRVMAKSADDNNPVLESLEILILDAERGGSGLIPLINTYWDQIMNACSDLINKECCVNGCYRCLKSYDNQWDHQNIKKSLFKVGTTAPLFDALKRSHWKAVAAGKGQEVDSKSPAEAKLADWLKQNRIDYTTQSSHTSISGNLITQTDFVIDSGNRKIQLFVDGWEYHGNVQALLADCEKRNALAARGWSVMWVPGHWPSQKVQLTALAPLLAENAEHSVLVRKDKVAALPPSVGDLTLKHLNSLIGGQVFNMLAPLDLDDSTDPRCIILRQATENLVKKFHPYAMSESGIVMLLVTPEIVATKETWNSWCLMQSALASLGYRCVNVWLGDR